MEEPPMHATCPDYQTYDLAIQQINERADDIAASPLFWEAVKQRGYKLPEQIRDFGIRLALASMYDPAND